MLSIYENDSIMRTSRPPGANAVETKLLICVYTRDYMFELKANPQLQYIPYVVGRFITAIKPKDPKTFEDLIRLEIANAQELSLVTHDGELTSRGIVFLDGSLNGSYYYTFPKFDNMMAMYMTVLAMPEFQTLGSGGSPEFCQCEDCMKEATEYKPLESPVEGEEESKLPEVLKVDIPMKDFIYLVDKYKPNSIWNKFKRLFN